MFSPWINHSHRLRLTVLVTTFVGIALAAVFALTLLLVRNQALDARTSELSEVVERIAQEWDGSNTVMEERDDFPDVRFTVYGPDGKVLTSSTKTLQPNILGPSKQDDNITFGVKKGDETIVGAVTLRETERGVHQVALVFAILWLPLTAATALLVWYVGGKSLKPVTELVDSAEQLAATGSDESLATSDRLEFGRLADSLNRLLTQVREAARSQERFASDAAHELRSPLARLQTRIETTLLRSRPEAEYQETLRSMLTEVEGLTGFVEALLQSARGQTVAVEPRDISNEVIQTVNSWRESKGLPESAVHLKSSPATAALTSTELTIVLQNLLDNALRFTPENQPIEVTLVQTNSETTLTVRDHGPGIPEDQIDKVFNRLYRIEEDRSRDSGGAGIGLALVKRIVETRNGTVSLVNANPGLQVDVQVSA